MDTARAGVEARVKDATALDDYFRTRHQQPWTDVAVKWQGIDFEPPDEVWFEVNVLWGDGEGETAGDSGTNTVPGVLVFTLFDRPGAGLGALYDLADVLRDLFDRVTVGAVEFLVAGGPRRTMVRDTRFVMKGDTRWEQMSLSVPFILEESS